MGRKPLLLLGVKLIGIGMLSLTILFAVSSSSSSSDSDSSPSSTSSQSSSSLLSKFYLVIYVLSLSLITCGYSLSFGPIIWLLQSELFPIIIRSRIMSFTVLINNILQFVVNYLFLPMINSLGKNSYLIYGGYFIVNILCYYFVTYFTIETNNLNKIT